MPRSTIEMRRRGKSHGERRRLSAKRRRAYQLGFAWRDGTISPIDARASTARQSGHLLFTKLYTREKPPKRPSSRLAAWPSRHATLKGDFHERSNISLPNDYVRSGAVG
jgi:hypothetical protein